MSRLSAFAISKRSVVLLLAIAVFGGGFYAWSNLKQELLPDIALPVISVIAPYPGVGAADVTDQVTKPIEHAISGIPRLERTQSTSANSISLVVAQFSYGTDVKEARASIEQNLQSAGLPQGVNPTVTALDINASPVIIASIGADGPDALATVGNVVRTDVVPALQGLDGVGSVDVAGGLEQRVMVTLDPAKLAADGISAQQVSGVLQANNLTLPAGQLPQAGTNVPVSATSSFTSLDQIRGLIVGFRSPPSAAGSNGAPAALPTPVTIADLGTVDEVSVPTTGYARTNGSASVTINVSKTSGANTVDVADRVSAALDAAQARNPQLRITIVSDLSTFIKQSRDGLVREGGLGALFAVLTIFLFLFSLRSTLVAAMSIPLSILAALVLMLGSGVTINIMTLGGLAVAVGRVVDDAIVVLENIYRHRARGDDKVRAILDGAREVAGAITASTATTVAVFLPLGFVGGIVSQFFLPFALTVTFALLASLVCALTVVPTLAYFLVDRIKVDVDENGEPRRSLWVRVYTPTIRFALRNRWTKWGVVALAAVLFTSSMALVPMLPTQFINAGGEKIVTVQLAPPPGTASSAVLAETQKAEAILQADRGNVRLIQASIPGEGDTGLQTLSAAFSGRASNSATVQIKVADAVDLNAYTKSVVASLGPVSADGYDVTATSSGFGFGGGINVVVSSSDPAAVARASTAIVDSLRQEPDLINVKNDLAKAAPAVAITVDPNKALSAGLTTAQVGGEVRTILVAQKATRVELDGRPAADLYVRVDPAALGSVDALKALPVGTSRKVQLGTVADIQQVGAQGSITRIDERPASSITADITSDDTGGVSRTVQERLDALRADGRIPSDVDVQLAGVTQQQNTAFGGLFASMAVAILLVYVMMVLTFNSLVTPFIIMFSLPLATIGAFPALFLTHRAVGISALIGFLMLIGIVVTNAIVLLDLVERLRREGHPTTEALVEGGKTRVRPILMTAIATVLALIPLAAGLSEGSIIAAELGTVVIGGLFSSTFLTLVVIPVVYSLVDGGKGSFRGILDRPAEVEVALAAASPPSGSGASPA